MLNCLQKGVSSFLTDSLATRRSMKRVKFLRMAYETGSRIMAARIELPAPIAYKYDLCESACKAG